MRDQTRTVIIAIFLVLVPMLLFANVWQSYRYSHAERAIATMQLEHIALLEGNTRLIVGIAGLRSPDRIRSVARSQLGLAPLSADQVQRIDVDGSTNAN